MKFGYFFTMYNFGHEPHKVIVDRALEQTLVAEDAGFENVWMGEHHFGGEGWDVHPNPLMTGTYLASKTSRIRIGLAAAIAPEWHPLRLAEDVAVLDHLSDGRVECGVGRGITSRELSNLNLLNPDRRPNDARNWEIFLETVEILKKAWTEDPFTFDGKYYKFPRPGVHDSYAAFYPRNPGWRSEDGEYVGMSIVPKPAQKPHPPLWITVDKTPGFAIAAEHGLKPLTWLRSKRALVDAFEVYRAAVVEHQGRKLQLGEECGLLRVCYVARTMKEARRVAEPATEALYRDYMGGLRSRDIYAEPGEKLSAEEIDRPWFEFLVDRGHLFVGTPDSVAEDILEVQETASPESLLVFNWLPGLTHEQVLSSLDLFAERVVPRVRGAEPAVVQ
jgi:alkanesulfonate monooxygenase SsuD/methylene tetrahydromethanopterin reductase-like flavin-dependent oxidoreductase (luciferase family)